MAWAGQSLDLNTSRHKVKKRKTRRDLIPFSFHKNSFIIRKKLPFETFVFEKTPLLWESWTPVSPTIFSKPFWAPQNPGEAFWAPVSTFWALKAFISILQKKKWIMQYTYTQFSFENKLLKIFWFLDKLVRTNCSLPLGTNLDLDLEPRPTFAWCWIRLDFLRGVYRGRGFGSSNTIPRKFSFSWIQTKKIWATSARK